MGNRDPAHNRRTQALKKRVELRHEELARIRDESVFSCVSDEDLIEYGFPKKNPREMLHLIRSNFADIINGLVPSVMSGIPSKKSRLSMIPGGVKTGIG